MADKKSDHVNTSETINDGQWTERKVPAGMSGVIATRFMDAAAVEEYRRVLVQRYRPPRQENIIWKFVSINDAADGDAREFLWLIFYEKIETKDKNGVFVIKDRELCRLKQPIPENLRDETDRKRRDQQRARRRAAAASSGVPLAGDFYTTSSYNFGAGNGHVPPKRRNQAQKMLTGAGK